MITGTLEKNSDHKNQCCVTGTELQVSQNNLFFDNRSVANWSLKMSFSIYFTQERKTLPYLMYMCTYTNI